MMPMVQVPVDAAFETGPEPKMSITITGRERPRREVLEDNRRLALRMRGWRRRTTPSGKRRPCGFGSTRSSSSAPTGPPRPRRQTEPSLG